MSRKLFNIVAILAMLSMMIIPVSAQPNAARPVDPNGKFQFEAVGPSDIKQVGNPNATVKGEIKGATGEATYIIRLADAPLASYRGGVAGLEATSPAARGAVKLDVSSRASQNYLAYLEAEQARMVSEIQAEVGRSVEILFQYQVAYNGLAVVLTPEEAAQVAKLPGVVNVQREFLRFPTTDAGPAFIGAPGIWDGSSTPGLPGTQGEGVVVGIIDTGLNLDNPSFADVGDDGYDHINPLGSGNYLGLCASNPGTWVCNDKLFGYYIFTGETTEDTDGHGSHTGSTTAGNVIFDATVAAPTASYTADISGVAPHANIIGYDACLDGGGCPLSALVAAINQATANGVDVINYSIGGGSSDPWGDDDALAFLNAVEAGVIPVTSAGNSGPGAGTLGSPAEAPWMLAVGASTHDRYIRNDLVNMTGPGTPPGDMIGKGLTDGYGPAPIVYAGDFGNALCGPGVWAPGTFSGQIVVCDRGTFGRVQKSEVVAAAGGGGYVLANDVNSADTLNGDPFAIPGVHITYADGVALKAWLATGNNHQATISGFSASFNPAFGDAMAAFSSRGPSPSVPMLIKPDVTAPGLDIMAAYSDPEDFNIISGTSMSSPHTAGAAALMRALYPTWTVAEIKSALMSTAFTGVVKQDGSTPADPFDMGAGRVDLSGAGAAGLVLDIPTAAYADADPAANGDPRTLNLPSLGDNKCLQVCTWTRTVTSVASSTVDWEVSATSADGVAIDVSPSNFSLAPGASQSLVITATVIGLPLEQWAFGEVMLEEVPIRAPSQLPSVHFPLAVFPVSGVVPNSVEIITRRNAGSQLVPDLQTIEVTQLTAEYFGFTQATLTSQELSQDPTNGNPYDNLNDGTTLFITTTVPADAKRLVAEITYSEAPDIDLFVGSGSTPSEATELAFSAGGSWNEYVNLNAPAAGVYWILVQNWDESATPPDLVTLASAVVTDADAGNMTVTGPASVQAGELYDIRVYWNTPEMVAGDRWYGAFSLGSDPSSPGDIATIPVDIVREADDVTKEASAEVVMPGDTVTYTLTVQPNVFSEALNYTITDTIPAGLTYVPGSASASDGSVSVVGNQVQWSVLMPLPQFDYAMTTSANDPFCDTGFGGYLDLEEIGFFTNPAISGDTVAFTAFSTGNPFNYYGTNYQGLTFTDDGFALFDFANNYGGAPWTPQFLPDADKPNNVLAALWQDFEIFYDAPTNAGVTLVTAGAPGGAAIVEYDNIEFYGGSADNFDFQIVYWRAVDNSPGAYEIIFAYDNLNGDLTGPTTIGLENAAATKAVTLVNNGDASGAISNGFMVCFDYQAFGFDPVTLTYQATVDEGVAPLTELTNNAAHNTDNLGSLEAVASDSVRVEGARLEVAHLAPFAADPGTAVTVTLNGADALTNFEFADSTGYIPLFPGDYDVEIFPAGSASPAISGTVTLLDGKDYSAIATGDSANQSLGLLALEDDNTPPQSGFFHLRVGHLAPFAPGDALADVRLQDGTVVVNDIAFGEDTGFLPLPAGEYDLMITSPDGSMIYIDPLPVTFNDGDIVSAYAVGDGVNQPLGVFAWPAGTPGFLLPLAEEPVDYGVELTPSEAAKSGVPGATVMYALELTNTGSLTNTFAITYTGNTWDVHLVETSVELGAGDSAELMVHVMIPADAEDGDMDMVTIQASGEGEVSATSDLTTSAIFPKIYLPVVPQAYNAP